MEEILQKEAHLKNLKETAQAIASATGPIPQALSCNIGSYTGSTGRGLGDDLLLKRAPALAQPVAENRKEPSGQGRLRAADLGLAQNPA